MLNTEVAGLLLLVLRNAELVVEFLCTAFPNVKNEFPKLANSVVSFVSPNRKKPAISLVYLGFLTITGLLESF